MDISEIDTERGDTAPEAGANPDDRPRRGRSGLALVALVVALGALAGTSWLWWRGQESRQAGTTQQDAGIARLDRRDAQLSAQFQELREAVDSLSSADREDTFAELQAGLAEDRVRLDRVERSLKEQEVLSRSLQSATDAMHGRLLAAEAILAQRQASQPDVQADLELAEVDYLTRLADERLQLFSDPLGADRALGLADRQLEAMANPSYFGVRQAIATARTDLAAVEVPDEPGIAARLDSLQESIGNLPFRTAAVAATAAAPAMEAGWWEKLKNVFAGLVTVRRSTDEENRRVSLQDKDYIRQQMWLQVEIARLALMRRDEPAFRAALTRLQDSLTEWFDPANGAVRTVTGTLRELAAVDIAVTWPDISAPWTMLRAIRPGQEARSALPAEAAPAAADGGGDGTPESRAEADEPERVGDDGQ